MTTHLRTSLRDAMATAVTGLTSTGSRVHKSRLYPVAADALPCLLVACGEQEQIQQESNYIQQRTLLMTVRGMAKATGDLDATLNQIALEVEAAVQAAGVLGGKVDDVTLIEIRTDVDDSMDKPVGVIELTYRLIFFTVDGAAGANA